MNINTLLDSIFDDGVVSEEYIEACDKLLLALRASERKDEYDYVLWDEAGLAFLATDKKDWGNHFIRYAEALNNDKIRKGSGKNILRKKRVFINTPKMKMLTGNWL